MKLELIITKEKCEEDLVTKTSVYNLGGYYEVVVTKISNVSGKFSFKIIRVSADFEEHTKNYLPEIYFNESKSQFEIQTTSWGTMDANEIEKVISGYNTAIEAVAILTEALL